MARHAQFIRFTVLTLLLGLAGCTSLPPKPDALPYHSLYETIEDPEALRFLDEGIAFLRAQGHDFEFPVNKVLLRQSVRNAIGRQYAIGSGFSKTEIVDPVQGVFAIYIEVAPEHPEFYLLLAHEIGHLRQPSLVNDWPMEGFCMVFSEELCKAKGKDWSLWAKRFTRHSKDPYAIAYWEVKEQR